MNIAHDLSQIPSHAKEVEQTALEHQKDGPRLSMTPPRKTPVSAEQMPHVSSAKSAQVVEKNKVPCGTDGTQPPWLEFQPHSKFHHPIQGKQETCQQYRKDWQIQVHKHAAQDESLHQIGQKEDTTKAKCGSPKKETKRIPVWAASQVTQLCRYVPSFPKA